MIPSSGRTVGQFTLLWPLFLSGVVSWFLPAIMDVSLSSFIGYSENVQVGLSMQRPMFLFFQGGSVVATVFVFSYDDKRGSSSLIALGSLVGNVSSVPLMIPSFRLCDLRNRHIFLSLGSLLALFDLRWFPRSTLRCQ